MLPISLSLRNGHSSAAAELALSWPSLSHACRSLPPADSMTANCCSAIHQQQPPSFWVAARAALTRHDVLKCQSSPIPVPAVLAIGTWLMPRPGF